jgi:hypothetical protein
MKENFPKREFLNFLSAALEYGWPSNFSPSTSPELKGFNETKYVKGNWEYFDLWSGGLTDIGFEIVKYKTSLVWGVTYRGGIVADHLIGKGLEIDPKEVFSFLMQALKAPKAKKFTLRGPAEYSEPNKEFLYRFMLKGDCASFIAFEEILFKSTIVYQRTLVGGNVGDNMYYGAAFPTELTWKP